MSKKKRNILSLFSNYPIYFIVGAFNTIFTIVLRGLIGVYINDKNLLGYIISMVFAYTVGILVSFILHSYFTFPKSRKSRKSKLKIIIFFYANQSFGMGLTILLSLLIRKGLSPINILTKFDTTIAFSMAAILTSIATYIINKKIIFRVN